MRANLPVTQKEQDYPADQALVSTTDARGRITHCNAAFVKVCGYDYEELLGQPHNLIRHPDMPEEAFRDMWSTIGHGRPWSGIVKNRCKNGDHYWVLANVTPVLENGKPVAYMSVRLKPSREQVRAAEALYATLRKEQGSGRKTVRLHAGGVRYHGPRDWPYRVFRLSLSQRLGIALMLMMATGLVPQALGAPTWLWGTALAAAMTVLMAWFHLSVSRTIAACGNLAAQIAGGNLTGGVRYDMRHPLGHLTRNVWLANLNMRAVVDDVRSEVASMTAASHQIAEGSQDLSARAGEQSGSVQRTASSMEEISTVVQGTAQTAREVERMSESARSVANRGGQAVTDVVQTMQSIEQSSRRVQEVIQVIEGIAFQTNILSLNAAVEAARAGDEGRGFAVVASEVRALAHRSAEAAREIRGLIGHSVEQVGTGSQRVHSAEEVIAQVVNSVEQVSELVRTITAATAQQSQGLGEINEAIAEIDHTTQRNAELSEQSSAACQVLQKRASTLVRAVQIFRVAP